MQVCEPQADVARISCLENEHSRTANLRVDMLDLLAAIRPGAAVCRPHATLTSFAILEIDVNFPTGVSYLLRMNLCATFLRSPRKCLILFRMSENVHREQSCPRQ